MYTQNNKRKETEELFSSVFTCKCNLNSHRLIKCGYDCQVIFDNKVTTSMLTSSNIYNDRINSIPPPRYILRNRK